jgi:hypothetical protein
MVLEVFHFAAGSQELFEFFVALDDEGVQHFQMRRFIPKLMTIFVKIKHCKINGGLF